MLQGHAPPLKRNNDDDSPATTNSKPAGEAVVPSTSLVDPIEMGDAVPMQWMTIPHPNALRNLADVRGNAR